LLKKFKVDFNFYIPLDILTITNSWTKVAVVSTETMQIVTSDETNHYYTTIAHNYIEYTTFETLFFFMLKKSIAIAMIIAFSTSQENKSS
jgi:hypothetical protein